MPYISIQGTDIHKNIQVMDVQIRIDFSPLYYANGKKRYEKLQEIQAQFEKIVQEYFVSVESEWFTNHDWNKKMNG